MRPHGGARREGVYFFWEVVIMIGRVEFEIIFCQCGANDEWNWLSLVFRSLVVSSSAKRSYGTFN